MRYANRHGDLVFISAVIINKDRVDSASHLAFEQFIGTNLIQLAWVFTLLRSFRSGLFLDEQLIAAKIGSSGGFDAIRVFGINYGQIVNTCLGQGTRLSNLLLMNYWNCGFLGTGYLSGNLTYMLPPATRTKGCGRYSDRIPDTGYLCILC